MCHNEFVMVRILTKDFTELDLTKGFEFQIEMENPMLEEDHIPSAFSTQISFPPSPVNRRVFGYTPAMFLAPNVKRLEASVWIGGVPFVSGTLVYDGIEDGCLMYTFTEKVVELEGKIWDQEILEFDVRNGVPSSDLFSTPLLIRKSGVALHPYEGTIRSLGPQDTTKRTYQTKYLNYVSSYETFDYSTFTPAVRVSTIMRNLPVDFPTRVSFITVEDLCVLGCYHEIIYDGVTRSSLSSETTTRSDGSISQNNTTLGGIETGNYITDVAHCLPDITFANLIKNLCSIFGASCFAENYRLKIMFNTSILGSSPTDWTDKINDDFATEEEPSQSYSFGYEEEESNLDGNTLQESIQNGTIAEISDARGIEDILDCFDDKEEYKTVFCKQSGDIYSGRKYTAYITQLGQEDYVNMVPLSDAAYECDVLYTSGAISKHEPDNDSDEFSNKSDFTLVRCSPEKIFYGETARKYRMTPIIDVETGSSERSKKTYIGVMFNDQLISNGFACNVDLPLVSSLEALSITPAALWDKYHKAFAEWLWKTRQRVSVDVNLSPIDLHNFRLYRPVYFKGRKWIVAKLSVTVAAGSEAVSTRGEFIEI